MKTPVSNFFIDNRSSLLDYFGREKNTLQLSEEIQYQISKLLFVSVIVSEGYMAPFIGFIKSGECHILRQVEVMHTLPNGKRVGRLIYTTHTGT